MRTCFYREGEETRTSLHRIVSVPGTLCSMSTIESSHDGGSLFRSIVSGRLRSSCEGLTVSLIHFRVHWLFLGLAHRNVGWMARANAFEVVFRVTMFFERLRLGAQKVPLRHGEMRYFGQPRKHFMKKKFKNVSREFDEFRVDTHLCKLRCWYL